MKKIIFWELLDGKVAAQCLSEFFVLPNEAAQMVIDDKEIRFSIAKNFNSAPFKSKSIDITGAVIFDEITIGE